MAECTIEELRATEGCPANTTLKALNWAQLQMLCSINDWLSGVSINPCDFDDLLEGGRCANASVVELEYWQSLKLCELVTGLSGGGGIGGVFPVGTANYLPKWSATTPHLTATSLVYDSGTGVGIGTTSIGALFQVGTMRVWQGGLGTSAATGEDSTFIGRLAGNVNNPSPSATNGIYNTFVGSLAGPLNTSGYAQTFLGYAAGAVNTTGGRNTFLGYQAGIANTIGDDNVFIGVDAGFGNIGASRSIIIGFHAGILLNPPNGVAGNVIIGYEAAAGISSAISNTMIGYRSGYSNTSGNVNTFVGNSSGFSNTTGLGNTFLGYQAGNFNTIGSENTFIGVDAGLSNVGATRSVIIGYRAGNLLVPATGIGGNVIIGYEASQAAGTGTLNTMVGYRAGYSNTSALANTYLGNTAGFGNTTGTFNVAIGEGAGISNVGGDNTFVGARTGYNHTSGANNTYLGKTAGFTNITGDQNVFLGKEAGYYETGSQKLFIDNAARSSEADARVKALIYGVFNAAPALQFLTFNANLTVVGYTAFTPSTLQTLAAANPILANATKVRVEGSGGAVTLTGTPTIADGADGQIVYILGTSDVNTITVQDQGTLAGSNLELGAATRVLGKGDILVLMFNLADSVWYEVSFSNN